jgi:protease IV
MATLKGKRSKNSEPSALMMAGVNFFGEAATTVANRVRERFEIDYVVFELDSIMPPLPMERNFIQQRLFGEPPMSLLEFDRALRRVGRDPRVKGVLLMLRGFAMSLADLQTLRDSLKRFRETGKRLVCYAQEYDLATYYIASAADTILMQPGGIVATIGLNQQAVFLKDALDQVGVGIDVVAISPYKGALDQLSRSDISEEGRQQLEWLLDSRYNQLVSAIAEGRQRSQEEIQAFIDNAPYIDQDALSGRWVDALLNEEQIPEHLSAEHLIYWDVAQMQLKDIWRKVQPKFVAVLELTGMIVSGESQEPPPIPLPVPLPLMGESQLGDSTVVQQVRQLIEDENAAAVVLFIDSPGGSASASEAMTSALEQLAKTRPVIVYMNAVAASGGYYIATPAKYIVAQPGTITGSIGVINGKAFTPGLFQRLDVNRLNFWRGRNATIFADTAPFTDEQRRTVRKIIERIYDQFVERVATSRGMSTEAVDAISSGRVWTGEQALANGLVDELGNLDTAARKAREFANLAADVPLRIYREKPKKQRPPKLVQQAVRALMPFAGLSYLYNSTRKTLNGSAQVLMPFEIK